MVEAKKNFCHKATWIQWDPKEEYGWAWGAARPRGLEAVWIRSPSLASASLAADWHFPSLSPHGGTGLPTASAFSCLHFQTLRGRLTSFLSVAVPKSWGRALIGQLGSGAHFSTNGQGQECVPLCHRQTPVVPYAC